MGNQLTGSNVRMSVWVDPSKTIICVLQPSISCLGEAGQSEMDQVSTSWDQYVSLDLLCDLSFFLPKARNQGGSESDETRPIEPWSYLSRSKKLKGLSLSRFQINDIHFISHDKETSSH